MSKYLVLSALIAGSMLVGCASDGEKTGAGSTGRSTSNSGLSTGGAGSNATGSGRELAGQGVDLSKRVIFFDFDSSELSSEGQAIVANWAKHLSQTPASKVRLEGSTDERGSREYNVALGERRARSVQQALQLRGVSAGQLTVISYGEERPASLGHDESAWAENRRVEFVQQ